MECPNCGIPEKDDAAECSGCGLIFAKWRAPSKGPAPAEPEIPAPRASARPSEGAAANLAVWIGLFFLTAAVWAFDRWGDPEQERAGPAAFFSKALPAPASIPRDHWRFEGKVFDLARGGPIKGARVGFLDLETNYNYEDVTDDEGHYAVNLPIRWKLGYTPNVSQPLYGARLWSGQAMTLSRSTRLRIGLEPSSGEAEGQVHRGGRKKVPVVFDFALFPQDLTDAERREASQ